MQVPTGGKNHVFSILATTPSPVPHQTPCVPSQEAATVSRPQISFSLSQVNGVGNISHLRQFLLTVERVHKGRFRYYFLTFFRSNVSGSSWRKNVLVIWFI